MARKTALSILFVGFVVAGTSFFSLTAHAQTKTIDGVSDPKNVSGLNSCTTAASSFIQSTFNTSCGDTFTQPGSFAIGDPLTGNTVPYSAGDIAKCTWTPFTSSAACVVSHQDGTYTTYNTSGVSGALTTTQLDSKGNPIGTPDQQSTLDAVAIKPVVNAASSVLSGIGNEILKAVGSAILTFANFLLGIAGVLFNLVIFYGVFQFANTIGNAPGVLTAWGILRDLANMALLFGFIFMGIATILDTGAVQGFTAKKALPKLLIFAVLMNFSLFTCEAMIDVSNALASSMYTQSNTSACASNDTKCVVNYGLAGHIMQSTGLGGIWAVTAKGDVNLGPVQYFGLALFATIGAIVFFAASIMLAIRVIVLTFLMIVSPIGFAGMAIPPLQKFAGDWWQRVIHQAFYAPIMLLLILISLKVSDSFTNGQYAGVNNALGGTIGNVVTDPNASTVSVVLVFMLIIGFMVASLIIANRFGAAGASFAVSKSKNFVLGAYGRTSGLIGRNTMGRASNWAQKSYKSNTALRSAILKTPGLKGLDSGIIKTTDKGKKGTYGGALSIEDIEKRDKERAKTLSSVQNIEDLKKAVNSGNAQAANEAMSKISKVSDKDLPDVVAALQGNEKALQRLAEGLSSEKFEKLMNNDDFRGDLKGKMLNARFVELHEAVNEAAEAAQEFEKSPTNKAAQDDYNAKQKKLSTLTGSLNQKDMGQLASSTDHSSVFSDSNFASALSEDQFKDTKKNNNLSSSQIQNLSTQREARQGNAVHVLNTLQNLTPEAAGKLPGNVLVQRDAAGNFLVLDNMSARQLASIDPTKLAASQGSDVGSYIKVVLARMNDKTADEFRRLYNASPELQRRWPS